MADDEHKANHGTGGNRILEPGFCMCPQISNQSNTCFRDQSVCRNRVFGLFLVADITKTVFYQNHLHMYNV